jgi:hypothetical protein
MVWNDEAYDHLVYDEQQKDLVMSFVENHGAAAEKRRQNKVLRDVIAGKGEFPFHLHSILSHWSMLICRVKARV